MPHLWTIFFGLLCLGGAAGYVVANSRAVSTGESLLAKAMMKGISSTSFVALALINGAAATAYGRAILAALVLSWLGDILLLSRQSTYLLLGIAAFFVAHIAYIAAFATREFSFTAMGFGLFVTGLLAVLILRWLWKHLIGVFVFAVPVYLAAIMLMVSAGIAASVDSLPLAVALAAIFFAASDISVARDRFIERDVLNKAWGLPLYYLAQLLFAASVASVR